MAAGIVMLVAAAFLLVGHVRAADTSGQSGRLITIHDRGQQKVFLTNAKTIAGALEDGGVALDAKDIVEPALTEALVASEYSVNIYRARPVIVVDGPLRQKVVTAYQTASQIVADTGFSVYPEDVATISRSDNILADGAGLQLTIDRAILVSLNLYGTTSQVRTQGATVGDMLREKNIDLGQSGRASVPLDTPISAGLEVRIWREGKQTITVDEAIAFDTEQIRDADRPTGYKNVQTVGVDGRRSVTYEIDIQNGVEVSRTEIASLTTKEPVKQVETIGVRVLVNVSYSADRVAIMTAAGVAPEDQDYAAYIINNENALWCAIRWQGTTGCGSSYYEKFPGAETSDQVGYGLCQSTPAIKMESAGADWRTNAVTQMRWCHQYAMSRYGSWQKAYEFKVTRGWW